MAKEESAGMTCYVCGVVLKAQFSSKLSGNSSYQSPIEKYPEMELWNGVKKEVCPDCFKAYKTGLGTYNQNLKNKQ